ncbi:MAG: helicase-exonuclease AddAB subunit AddA [Lachnospiraceae bacterium]|nr:helicase-exonuclease AddAB subunit AddA [Lachnospiraceae bacterium]
MPKWTDEQKAVIDSRDCNLLVSAGAGSGKTAVLVERIIQMITDKDKPLDVDKLVVVTFTKAAAAEMKGRIRTAIAKALEDDPDNTHLMRQQTLIHNARITTIDSFCLDIVRNYFHRIDLSPDFRISDEGELTLLKEDVMDEMLEEMYAEADPAFIRLVECYAPKKKDDEIRNIIMRIHDRSMSYPDSEEWIREISSNYEFKEGASIDDNPAVMVAVAHARAVLREMVGRLSYLVNLTQEVGGPFYWEELALSERDMVETIARSRTYSELYRALQDKSFGRANKKKSDEVDESKIELFKTIRDGVKTEVNSLGDKIISIPPEDVSRTFSICLRDMETIVNLTLSFKERYSKAKRDKKILDFSDIEHFALKILTNEDGSRSDVARQFASSVHEIFIDEYQDSNDVQESILQAVSGMEEGRNNIFMVGDVKQSIYRFRMAKPELFMDKYDKYTTGEGPNRRIDLHNNFRSRRQVIDSVNYVFRQLMKPYVGKVDYDKAAELVYGADYPEAPEDTCDTEFLIAGPGEDASLSGYAKRSTEAKMVALKIKQMVESGEFRVRDGEEGLRPLRYGDIAILFRSAKGMKDTFAAVLEEAGVPAKAASTTGYFDNPEVATVLSFLELIDNPMQDIPLAAVLRSPMVGMSSKELAGIRADRPDGSFYKAAMECEELGGFFDMLESFRKRAVFLPVNELIEAVVAETGYLDYVSSMPGGKMRRENLLMLIERAYVYEQTSYKGLFNFLRYISKMKKYEIDFAEPDSGESHEDKVSIMTIHKSKGLEFPVVFLCGLDKRFNKRDMSASVVIHPELGAGIECIDPDRRIKTPTIARNILAVRSGVDDMGEELRVLYVAMTRAKEKLIMTCYTDNVDNTMAKYGYIATSGGEALGFSDICGAGSFADMLYMTLIRNKGFKGIREKHGIPEPFTNKLYNGCDCIRVRDITAAEVEEEWTSLKTLAAVTEHGRMILIDPEHEDYYEEIEKRFSYEYPYRGEIGLKTKMSVSELKKRAYLALEPEEEETNIYNEETVIPYVPDFVEKKEEHQGVRRGNAYHAVMEHFDFTAEDLWGSFDGQIEDMMKAGYLDPEDREVLYRRSFKIFLESSLAVRMGRAQRIGKLYREKPFVMGVPARELVPESSGEEMIIVQGIIDAYFMEDDGIVLIDYKTDRVEGPEELVKRYKTQLDLYAEALVKYTDLPVKETIIYSFGLDREITL